MTQQADGLPSLSTVISQHGLWARKNLGQNFLLDLNLTAKIARQAGNLSNHDVLEIGPGPGGLTRALLLNGARHIVAVERDNRCLPILENISNHYKGRLKVLYGNALTIDPYEYLTPPVKIIANLPYNIGTELLIQWLTPDEWPPFWDSLTLMFQREVADRLVATPKTKAYGRLSILSQWRSDVQIAMHISPKAFTPTPKVTSSVVHITPHKTPRLHCNPKTLEHITAKAFGQRRKMLRSSLKTLRPDIETLLIRAGIEPTQRAEDLTITQFCQLSKEFE